MHIFGFHRKVHVEKDGWMVGDGWWLERLNGSKGEVKSSGGPLDF